MWIIAHLPLSGRGWRDALSPAQTVGALNDRYRVEKARAKRTRERGAIRVRQLRLCPGR